MSHLKPSYDDEELKGSVDHDFFSDGSESARKAEDDAQPSARSTGSRRSKLNSNRSRTPPSPDQSLVRQAGRSRSPSPASSRRSRSSSNDGQVETDRSRKAAKADQSTGSNQNVAAKRRRSSRSASLSHSSRSASSSRSGSTKASRSRSGSRSSSASDVTDVSPLSSPRPDSPRAGGGAPGTSSGKPPRASQGRGQVHVAEERDEDRINMETIVRALVELDKRRCQSAGPQRTGFHSGSQSMSRIHDIEAENQRLLYSLMRTKNRDKKPSNIDPPVKRPHHSTVNRQKEQRRIEEENRKIFQRLKQIRPTKGMSRGEMISDYKRQASFGLPLSLLGEDVKYRPPRITHNPYCQPVSRVHSSSSMVHQGGPSTSGVGSVSRSSSRPGSAASRASAASGRGTATAAGATRGGATRAGGGAASSGRAGWPAGW